MFNIDRWEMENAIPIRNLRHLRNPKTSRGSYLDLIIFVKYLNSVSRPCPKKVNRNFTNLFF